jgi:hypothetical protein
VYRIACVCLLVLACWSHLVASNEAENVEQHQDDAVPIHEEHREEIETRNREDPHAQQAEEVPVQDEEQPPAAEEESPPLHEEDPTREDKPEVIDASLFELNVFECTAPRGEPATDREGRLPPGSVVTLCFRPKHEHAAELKAIEFMEFSSPNGPTQAAIHNNEAAGPMTRAICPMVEDSDLCISATKLSDEFFAKAYNNVAAVGEVKVLVDNEQKLVPFRYEFSTAQDTKPQPVEHDFYEMPATPPSFPCSQEIRLGLLAALVLTLLEFAFSPSDDDKGGDGKSAEQSGTSSKKKKPKKE